MRLLLVFAVLPLVGICQTANAPLAFEVASIKPAPPPTGPGIRMAINQDKGRVTLSGLSLRNLMVRAYRIKQPQLVAPDWMDSTRFDIVAKLPEGATESQVPEMLRTLLEERFKVQIHKEQKPMAIYALVVAKGGPKLQKAESEGRLSMRVSPKGRKMEGETAMDRFVDLLSNMLDRPVLDFTELSGAYKIDLEWSPDESDRVKMVPGGPGPGRGPEGGEARQPETMDAPNIFTAVQEKMGLKLEARKAPVELIVVDHAEKVPTEN